MRYFPIMLLVFFWKPVLAQDSLSVYQQQKFQVRDSIVLDSAGINPHRFAIFDKEGNPADPFSYRVDFKKGVIHFSETIKTRHDSLTIRYTRYPDFLTRDYFTLSPDLIVEDTGRMEKLYSLSERSRSVPSTPFEGLNTSGSISRGITVGNNQNAVVNSQLDLQITGKLSENVSIRASIQDANLPTQEGGYSQSLDEFDQIFIELFGDNWNIRAGDIDLINQSGYFGRFTKKVQGISLGTRFKNPDGSTIEAFAAGALVKGIFTKSEFPGQEGNQGPYKLSGPNGELYILIVSGSERVYVNGLLLKRGENEDYIIDYNAGELKFNPTFPITSNMRIVVEYQFTDRNYTRYIGYGGGNYRSENLDLGVYVYSENDAKNQPLQQNLSPEQVEILKAAGDNPDLMFAPSAVPDTYSENKILYKKEFRDGREIFVYSNNPEDSLYHVRFSKVGENNGNYIVSNQSAISRIYEYIPPENGVRQGSYEPVIRLNPPEKLQVGGINGSFHPSEKTEIDFELAGSNYDKNLFSKTDNDDNTGFAGRMAFRQRILTTSDSLQLNSFGAWDYVHKNFQTIERLYNIEFDRDWNLLDPRGSQSFLTGGIEVLDPELGTGRYEFQSLNYSENFSGIRHTISSYINLKNLSSETYGSFMNSKADSIDTRFIRFNQNLMYSYKKSWTGGKLALENNTIRDVKNDSLSPLSQRFTSYEFFAGIGDSTDVFVKAGYQYRINDSIRNKKLQKVSSSNTYYLRSQLINSEKTQLSAYTNYRTVTYEAFHPEFSSPFTARKKGRPEEKEKSLNARIHYNQILFDGMILLNTGIESSNGVVPQQEYTFIKTDPGQGVYMWIDYNNNGIQELDEFEVAQFPDQAEYIRVLLPNQVFLKIRQNKFNQILTLNPHQWTGESGFKKILSHFYNQSSFLIDRKVRQKKGGFSLNPFKDGGNDQLGLSLNFRNVLFFNRGKQRYSTTYTFLSTSSDHLLATGLQEASLTDHQLTFTHKIQEYWLVNLKGTTGTSESKSESFPNRNFRLHNYEFNPKISYLVNPQTRFDLFYNRNNSRNQLGNLEKLDQYTVGLSFSYSNAEKVTINGEFNYIDNDFRGNSFSPVAYQMLEGLQPGINFTWRALLQKRITQYLDASLSYFGRKSETTRTVHTGSVQLRAYF